MSMNVLDALYNTVHDFDGGAEALAPRIGKRGTSLCHEVRPPTGSSAKAGLLDAVKIMGITRDHRVLHAMNAQLGFMAVPLPDAPYSGAGTLYHLADVAKEFAEVMQVVSAGTADGKISDNELASLQRQWSELIAAGQGLLSDYAVRNAAGRATRGDPCRSRPGAPKPAGYRGAD